MSEGMRVGGGDTLTRGVQSRWAGDTETLTGSSAHRFSQTSLHLQEQDQISKHPRVRWKVRSEPPSSCLPLPCGLSPDAGAEPPITGAT